MNFGNFESFFSYLLEELCVFSLCLSPQIRCESFSIKTLIEVEAFEIFEIQFIRAIRSNLIDYRKGELLLFHDSFESLRYCKHVVIFKCSIICNVL